MGYQPAFAMGTPHKPTSEGMSTMDEHATPNIFESTNENSTIDEAQVRANFELKEVSDESPIKRTNKSSVISKTADEMEEDTMAAGTGGQPREQKNFNIQKLFKDET